MSHAASTPRAAVGRRTRIGLAWQFLGRGGEQGVRLLAYLVLARLLPPEDFGLVGMATTGLAVADAVAFVGTDQAVMAHRDGRRPRFVATAWFLALVRAVLLAAVLALLAAPLARWYGQPEATAIFLAVALQPLLTALAHPGAFVPLRELRFGAWTSTRLIATTVGTAATIALAIVLHSVWALVLGHLATTALVSLASHLVTPRRLRVAPWPTRRHLRRLLRFSSGAVGIPVLIMLILQAPVLLIGPTLGPAALGVYLMLRRLCDTGKQLAVQAAGMVLVPATAALAGDRARLESAWARSIRATAVPAFGAAAVLGWLGGDLPELVLGPAFRGAPGLLAALAAAGALATLLGIAGPFLWGLSRPGDDRSAQLVRCVVVLGAGPVLLARFGPTGLAAATALGAAGGLATAAVLLRRRAGIRLRTTSLALVPGLVLAVAILGGGTLFDRLLGPPPVARLLVAAGITVNVALVLAGPAATRHGVRLPGLPRTATPRVADSRPPAPGAAT